MVACTIFVTMVPNTKDGYGQIDIYHTILKLWQEGSDLTNPIWVTVEPAQKLSKRTVWVLQGLSEEKTPAKYIKCPLDALFGAKKK